MKFLILSLVLTLAFKFGIAKQVQLVYGVDIPSSAEQICVEIDQTEPLSIPTEPTRVVTESNRDQVIGTRGKQCTGHSMICAKDLRSGGPQNFDSECHMFEENGRGGLYVFNHAGVC